MKLVYSFGFNTITSAASLIVEISSEIGIIPDEIIMDDGTSVALNIKDFKQLQKGDLSDEEYIAKHRIIQ